jgi:HPt (histidine-containing phosphotransfer) domain-containing protein
MILEDTQATPVDWTALMNSIDGDPEIAAELVQLFVTSGDQQLAMIVSAVAKGDYATIGAQAHSLKGASANLQARHASEAAARLETAARSRSPEVSSLAQELGAEVTRAMQFLRAKVA